MKETRERNHVDVFSNYGLDERQRRKSENIGFRCFRELYIVSIMLTVMWFFVSRLTGAEIPAIFVAGSYFTAALVCYCVYAVRAAKSGVINGITAFSFTTGKLAAAIITALLAVVFGLGAAGLLGASEKMTDSFILAILCAMVSAENFVLYFCGMKNNKVLDEQNKEDISDE